MNNENLKLLKRLWQHISPLRRSQFGLLLILIITSSFAEILSIGAILPFLAILTDPGLIYAHPNAKVIIQTLGIDEPKQLLLPLTVVFCVAAVVAGALRLLVLWGNTKLAYATGADISLSIYRKTLYQPYAVHCTRNSSEIIDGISIKTGNTIGVIFSILSLCSSIIIIIAILMALINVDPLMALGAVGGFGMVYFIIIRVTRNRLKINSYTNARESSRVIKCLQEGLGGIRDVLIDNTQEAYCQVYRSADRSLRRAQGNNSFIAASPRFAIEALGMLLIALMAYVLAQKSEGFSKAIPILGALALGSQRLLPVLQQAYASWTGILGSQVSLQDTIDLLNQPLPCHADLRVILPLSFKEKISLKKLSFQYATETPYVLKELSLTIVKGSRVGVIGSTGSGKSTLLDIIMGLLQPTHGDLEIDGQVVTPENYRSWMAHISHVPQTIFLADCTIEENIALGVPADQINHQRVRNAAMHARIASTIEAWPKKYKTSVGERGVRLSGGQRQRIGIARALYKQADVIILDEATSALDNETEEAVMESIKELSKDLTVIIIAHRLSTLKHCNNIIELEAGKIKRVCSFDAIVS